MEKNRKYNSIDLVQAKKVRTELLWVLLSAVVSLSLIFTFFNVTKGQEISIQISDTYFATDLWLASCVIFSVVGSLIFIFRNTLSRLKNLLQIIILTCFIGMSIYWLHQFLPTEAINSESKSDSGWVVMPPYSSLSTAQKIDVLGNLLFQGVWAVWLYFGLIISFIALLGRIFWLASAAKKTSEV